MNLDFSSSIGSSPKLPRRDFLKILFAGMGAEAMLESMSAQGATPFVIRGSAPRLQTGSDLGTLWHLIEKLATRPFSPMAFTQDRFRSLKHWRAMARAKIFELLHYAPPKWQTKGQTSDRIDRGDYVLEKVHFNTSPYFRIPAFVLVPKDAPRRETPALIVLHDHSGFYLWGKEKLVEDENENPTLREFKGRYYEGRSIASDLARQGFLVLVIDLMFWGERRMILDEDPDDWRKRPSDLSPERVSAFNIRSSQHESLLNRTLISAGLTWPGLIFWDDIRSVDYLLTRPEVDRNRIGAIGFSLGGIRANFLSALDHRIQTAVVAGWMSSIPYQLKSNVKYSIGASMLVPGLHRYLDYPDIAAMSAPKPLLVISGKEDGLFDANGVRESYEKLRRCYEKAGASDQLQLHEFEAGHVFNKEMQSTATAFFKETL